MPVQLSHYCSYLLLQVNPDEIKEGKDILEAAAGLNDFRNPYQASTAVAHASYQTGA